MRITLRYTPPSLPYHKPVQYHNLIVLYVTAISKVVIVVFLKTTINVRLGQYSGNCCFQKNNNYDFDIVVAYSTIRLWYYTGLWYGRLGKVQKSTVSKNISKIFYFTGHSNPAGGKSILSWKDESVFVSSFISTEIRRNLGSVNEIY